MEYRTFGHSGLKVPALSFGAATFAGTGMFEKWGATDVAEAKRMIDICLEHGVNFFDTADVYSHGASEQVLGEAIKNRRDKVLISTKSTFAMSDDPNNVGSSRFHLIKSCEDSLKRLGTDYIDMYFMHGFDATTPIEETLRTLDDLVRSGKIRYIGCSNFSGWHLMKSLSISEKYGLSRYIVYQGYYSLIGRDYEWELMPLGVDQNVGLMVWSPLGWGRLGGKIRRGTLIENGRIQQGGAFNGPMVSDEHLFNVVDVLTEIAEDTNKSVAQVALNWVLQRPTVCNVIIGARNEEQLINNLGAVGWSLTPEQIERLDNVSRCQPIYPYWHQMQFVSRNPSPVKW